MTDFWLGVVAGIVGSWALATITLVALRGAAHNLPMAAGHWDDDALENDVDDELRELLNKDTGRS